MRKTLFTAITVLATLHLGAPPAAASNVRDVAKVKGMREHRVIGVGLVVGLPGTGDKGRETRKRIAMMLGRLNLTVNPDDLPSKNVALVMISARIAPYAQKGELLDVTVNTFGDCTSLAGGELLPTPLHANDPEIVYARAQGVISVGGAGGLVNPTAGSIAGGATLEKEIPCSALEQTHKDSGVRYLDLILDSERGDFTLANSIAEGINTGLRVPEGKPAAKALSPSQVRVEVPAENEDRMVAFVDEIMNFPVVADPPARVVINVREGTVVATGNVRISPARVQVGPRTITISDESSLKDIEKSLTLQLGNSAELIAALKALKKAGALQAELISN